MNGPLNRTVTQKEQQPLLKKKQTKTKRALEMNAITLSLLNQ